MIPLNVFLTEGLKKKYKIEISGEDGGSCERELTPKEYELVSGILNECTGASDYISATIEEI